MVTAVLDSWPLVAIAWVALGLLLVLLLRPRAKPRVDRGGRDEPGLRDVGEELLGATLAGAVPGYEWLDGTLYRQSGAAFLPPKSTIGFAYVHGLAHVAAFEFCNGKVRMTNKAIRTAAHKLFEVTGAREWANPHEVKTVEGPLHPGALYDGPNPNVTVWKLGKEGKVAALSESARGRIIEVDGRSLETLQVTDTIADETAFLHAAHFFADVSEKVPTVGEETGFHVALTGAVGADGELKFGYALYHGDARHPPLQQVAAVTVAQFPREQAGEQPPAKRISYMHTLGVTSRFVVLFASDRRLDYTKWLEQREEGRPAGFFDLWRPTGLPASLFIFCRTGSDGQGLTYLGERPLQRPHMIWHTANAYEDEQGALVCEVSAMVGRERRLARYTVVDPLATGTPTAKPVLDEDLSMHAHEFPCVNPTLHGRKHRFTYALSEPYGLNSQLWKFDAVSGSELSWKGTSKMIPSEPVFVPHPSATDEDDGVVLAIINDSADDTSFLLLLDGRTFQEIARLPTPITVNHGIHTVWIPSKSAAKMHRY